MRKVHSTQTGRTILVVDDQEDSLISVQRLLQRQGHQVVTARGGEDALAALKEHTVEVALVDYAMPQMSGVDLIREIRRRDPFVQIILHSGYCGRNVAQSLLKELGIQGFHDKGEGPDKLLLWVQAALKHRSSIDRLRQRERMHRDRIADASHELRNPLHILCGYGDVLLSGAAGTLPAQAQPIIQLVTGRAHDLSDMTANILLYSTLEADAVQVVPREVETGQLVQGLQELADVLFADKNVEFTIDVPDPSSTLTTDPGKVDVILRNLVSNAARYTHQGSVYVRVTMHEAEIRCVVRDTGTGIAAEHLEDIFEPFWQSSTPMHGHGVGLGLTLSRRLASLLGGNLRVRSEVGAGSEFTLTLPVAAQLVTAPASRSAAAPPTRPAEIKTSRSPFGFFRPF